MEGNRIRLLRLAAVLLALQAACTLEIDSAYVERVGGMGKLAPYTPVHPLAGAGVALALLVLLVPRCAVACLALLVGAAALLASTPFNTAGFHLLQVLLLSGATALAVAASLRGGRMERVVARLGLVALVLLAGEGVFSMVDRSHAVGYTLAARLWYTRHWTPPGNAAGYRDVEHPEDGRKKLFVLGDSFVAGGGIRDVHARFSDRLQVLLGDRYQVHNLGYNGADTSYELQLLNEYPARPDVLVLSYYVNDIVNAASELGHGRPSYLPYMNVPWPVALVVSRSYLLDFAYWLLPQPDLRGESRFLRDCFTWPDVVARHREEIQRIVDWARERACPMIAVVFPGLTQLEASDPWVAPALEVFAQNGVSAVDVRKLVRDLAPEERVVNANDSHPSELVHARVAEALKAEVDALGR